MNAVLDRIRAYLNSRSARERWLLVAAGCVLGFFLVQNMVIARLSQNAERAEADATQLEADRLSALRLAADVQAIRGGLEAVEARIKPGEAANLLALLEQLAGEVAISKDQLEAIKPSPATRNPRYPETAVEVSLRGVSLEQTTRFLHKIETADSPLIIRSLGIRSRAAGPDSQVLDVKFSVSSFERTA